MKINKIIPIGLYPFDLMLSFNETDKEVKKALKHYGITDGDEILFDMDKIKDRKQGRTVLFTTHQSIIRLNYMPELNNPEKMSMLQHEIFHTVGFFMSRINTPLTDDTHEVYAYLVQYLTEQIYAILKGVKSKKVNIRSSHRNSISRNN